MFRISAFSTDPAPNWARPKLRKRAFPNRTKKTARCSSQRRVYELSRTPGKQFFGEIQDIQEKRHLLITRISRVIHKLAANGVKSAGMLPIATAVALEIPQVFKGRTRNIIVVCFCDDQVFVKRGVLLGKSVAQ